MGGAELGDELVRFMSAEAGDETQGQPVELFFFGGSGFGGVGGEHGFLDVGGAKRLILSVDVHVLISFPNGRLSLFTQ